MKRSPVPVLKKSDLLATLIREPELLALADALVVTGVGDEFRTPRRSAPIRLRAVALAAAAVCAVAVAAAAPWSGGASVVDDALAAVGSAPTLHVKIAAVDAPGGQLVDLESGAPIALKYTTEIWFDQTRDVKRTVDSINGRVVDEMLETPAGGVTTTGPIYTCAWIQAHPSAAARAGVSCPDTSAAGDRTPALEAALAEFLDGYRAALASGSATEAGEGEIAGRKVTWLRFSGAEAFHRVAVDAETDRPVRVESSDGSTAFTVLAANSSEYNPALFEKPASRPTSKVSGVLAERDIEIASAKSLLGQDGYWLGTTWKGYALVDVVQQERRLRSAAVPGGSLFSVVKLTYEPADAGRSIDIYLSPQCVVNLGWTCSPRDPADQTAVGYPVGLSGPALSFRDGLYISAWGFNGSMDESLELFRSLELVEGTD